MAGEELTRRGVGGEINILPQVLQEETTYQVQSQVVDPVWNMD